MSTTTTTIIQAVPVEAQLEPISSDAYTAIVLMAGPAIIYWFWICLLIFIWIISGFISFIASLVCLFYNSPIGDKMAGLVLALFAGPFYWLFYIYNSNYCNRYNSY